MYMDDKNLIQGLQLKKENYLGNKTNRNHLKDSVNYKTTYIKEDNLISEENPMPQGDQNVSKVRKFFLNNIDSNFKEIRIPKPISKSKINVDTKYISMNVE